MMKLTRKQALVKLECAAVNHGGRRARAGDGEGAGNGGQHIGAVVEIIDYSRAVRARRKVIVFACPFVFALEIAATRHATAPAAHVKFAA